MKGKMRKLHFAKTPSVKPIQRVDLYSGLITCYPFKLAQFLRYCSDVFFSFSAYILIYKIYKQCFYLEQTLSFYI